MELNLNHLHRGIGAYEDQPATTAAFTFPTDLSVVETEQLEEMNEEAVKVFNEIYGEGKDLSDEVLASLSDMAAGIEALQAEINQRVEAAAEREAKANELRERVNPVKAEEPEEDEEQVDEVVEEEDERKREDAPVVTASAEKTVRYTKRQMKPRREEPLAVTDFLTVSGEGFGVTPGTGVDWNKAGELYDSFLGKYSHNAYQAANRAGQHIQSRNQMLALRKPIPDDLMIRSNDTTEVENVISHAMDEKRLDGGSLVASGGWCAPSETLYGLVELETREGIFSLPEIGIQRGGIKRTLGPDFASIYADTVGFHYTEEQDIAGNYGVDENGDGNNTPGGKPCMRIPCPEFEEFRLGVAGLCVQAGLLQSRGYPEVIARGLRGILVAHDHKMSGRILRKIVEGSTGVTMPKDIAGAIAPLLNAIELQVEHYRTIHRMGRSKTLEAVFPFWVRGSIRMDLARRAGVDTLAVTDAQINSWFASRGVAPQFVYNWQDIGGEAGQFVEWPNEVQFLLYPAGNWVRGTSPLITMDSVYDSLLRENNDFTALFTEEGWLVMPMGHDSRVVTVPLCPNGAASAAVEFPCEGTAQTGNPTPTSTTTTTRSA